MQLDHVGALSLQKRDRLRESRIDRRRNASGEGQDAEAFALQTGLRQARRIVAAVGVGLSRRRIGRIGAGHGAEQDRHILDAASHRTWRVLAVRNGHDVGARDEADRGLQSDQTHHRRGAVAGAMGLGADAHRRQGGGDRGAGSRRGAAGGAVQGIGVLDQAADARPAADRSAGADVGPFRQVGLAQDHSAGVLQPPHQWSVPQGDIALQGQGARGGGHAVIGLDIVLDQHRYPVQRTAQMARQAFGVQAARGLQRVRIEHDNAVQGRTRTVYRLDPGQIGAHQPFGGDLAGGHGRLQLYDRLLGDRIGRVRAGDARGQRQRDAEHAAESTPDRSTHADAPQQPIRSWHISGARSKRSRRDGAGRGTGPPSRLA